MRTILLFVLSIFVAAVLVAPSLDAQYAVFRPSPVLHPVTTAPRPGVSPAYAWKQGTGAFAETAADAMLRRRGFSKILEFRNASGQGIDRIAFRYDGQGTVIDARIVECKWNNARLGYTAGSGKQMSRKWLADRLKAMRNSGSAGREAARELRQFMMLKGVPIEKLGEVFHLRPDGQYTLYDSAMANPKAHGKLDKLAGRMETRGPVSLKDWAANTRPHFERIGRATQGKFVTSIANTKSAAVHQASKRATQVVTQRAMRVVVGRGARTTAKVLARAAGPLGLAIGVAVDAHDVYCVLDDYGAGRISRNEMICKMSTLGGGIAGAAVGAWAGLKVGATLGLLGGPAAWLTVPVGGFICSVVCGVTGYFIGSEVGEGVANSVLEGAEREIIDRTELHVLGGR